MCTWVDFHMGIALAFFIIFFVAFSILSGFLFCPLVYKQIFFLEKCDFYFYFYLIGT